MFQAGILYAGLRHERRFGDPFVHAVGARANKTLTLDSVKDGRQIGSGCDDVHRGRQLCPALRKNPGETRDLTTNRAFL
ncbi:MAG TPA: hypothetical protein VGU01_00495 [Sphingomicrobium sp.]|nr:hypothetical protein [Sphingomicrobium sp.]